MLIEPNVAGDGLWLEYAEPFRNSPIRQTRTLADRRTPRIRLAAVRPVGFRQLPRIGG